MLTVVYLGTGAAVPAPGRDNTSLAIDDGETVTLVDVSGAPLGRLLAAGLTADRLRRVILTHEHVDHTYGLPSLLQSLWLSGRREPLEIWARGETWRVVDRLLRGYWPDGWAQRFPLDRQVLVPSPRPFLETPRLSLSATSVHHSVPTAALRFEGPEGAIVYSADTGPCEALVDLARGCDLLIHEATFLSAGEDVAAQVGHSTAAQAGEIGARAGAKRLAVVHFTPTSAGDLATLQLEAAAAYGGPAEVPGDLDQTELV